MATPNDSSEFRTSSLSRGRCFVYVLPCAYEDILKLGFSRDPLGRLQALHRRYFEFFDLGRALLIETETVREARRLELMLAAEIELHNAPAPLVTRREAGGHTEWYRGAFEHLEQASATLASAGYTMHRPALPWLRSVLVEQRDRLYVRSAETLMAIESGALPGDVADRLSGSLRDALDAYVAFAIDLEPLLPESVYRWHCASRRE